MVKKFSIIVALCLGLPAWPAMAAQASSSSGASPLAGLSPQQGHGLTVDWAQRQVHAGQAHHQLSAAEFRLLEVLARHAGETLAAEELAEALGGLEQVDPTVGSLREKIEPDPRQPQRLLTVNGGGYRFNRLPDPGSDDLPPEPPVLSRSGR